MVFTKMRSTCDDVISGSCHMRVSKNEGPSYRPRIVGLLLQGRPQNLYPASAALGTLRGSGEKCFVLQRDVGPGGGRPFRFFQDRAVSLPFRNLCVDDDIHVHMYIYICIYMSPLSLSLHTYI